MSGSNNKARQFGIHADLKLFRRFNNLVHFQFLEKKISKNLDLAQFEAKVGESTSKSADWQWNNLLEIMT